MESFLLKLNWRNKMGKVSNPVNLEKLIQVFDIKNFVETGTGDGTSMMEVYNLNLVENLYGIELDNGLFEKLKSKFLSVNFYNGYSKDELVNVAHDLDENPTLFWLDAHFPNSDYFGVPYDSEPDKTKRIPLEIELTILKESRDISKDVFIMDDLRIYVDREYADGSWNLRPVAGDDGYDFVENTIGDTHLLVEHYGDQGYLLAYPLSFSEDDIKTTIKGL